MVEFHFENWCDFYLKINEHNIPMDSKIQTETLEFWIFGVIRVEVGILIYVSYDVNIYIL